MGEEVQVDRRADRRRKGREREGLEGEEGRADCWGEG